MTPVYLRLNVESDAGGLNEEFLVYCLTPERDFVESQVTWNNYKTGTAWTTAGGAGSGDVYPDVPPTLDYDIAVRVNGVEYPSVPFVAAIS
jgi:hypothetical protein